LHWLEMSIFIQSCGQVQYCAQQLCEYAPSVVVDEKELTSLQRSAMINIHPSKRVDRRRNQFHFMSWPALSRVADGWRLEAIEFTRGSHNRFLFLWRKYPLFLLLLLLLLLPYGLFFFGFFKHSSRPFALSKQPANGDGNKRQEMTERGCPAV
jgi:hypothetical protein